jgi:hypothetical protein
MCAALSTELTHCFNARATAALTGRCMTLASRSSKQIEQLLYIEKPRLFKQKIGIYT